MKSIGDHTVSGSDDGMRAGEGLHVGLSPKKRRYLLKIVKDSDPNEDGRWIERFLDVAPRFDDVIVEGTHVVTIRELPPPPQNQPFYQHSNQHCPADGSEFRDGEGR